MGTPDVQSAALGSGAVRDHEPHLYIGTSDWLTCHVPYKKTDLSHNMASLPSAIPNRYLLTNEQESAGACLQFLADNVFFADDELNTPRPTDLYARFDAMAARVAPGSDGLLFTPWLYGERTPVEDHTVRASFANLSLRTTRAHIVRATMEGVAHNVRWLLGAVEQFTGRRMSPINFIGGGCRSVVWRQILADVLDREICAVADPVQANVRGAAWLAAASLNLISFDDLHTRVRIVERCTPRAEHRRTYDALYKEFLELYKRTRPIYGRLNRKG
jgi:xylulokinase